MTPAELFPILVEGTLASSAALLAVLAFRHPLRGAFGPVIAYFAWALVPLAILAVLLPAPQATADTLPALVAMQVPIQMLGQEAGEGTQVPAMALAMLAWLCGMAVCATWMGFQQHRFVRALGRLDPREGGVLIASAAEGLPAVIGLFRPRIVLPCDAAQRYSVLEQGLMLAHERTHIARGDLFANAAFALLRIVFWFNPLVHLAASRFRHDQELACDQQVIRRHPHARRRYGEAMLKTQLAGGALPLGCHWGQTHPLRERIEMLKKPLPTLRRSLLGSAIATGLLFASAYAVWAAQPPDANAPKVSPREQAAMEAEKAAREAKHAGAEAARAGAEAAREGARSAEEAKHAARDAARVARHAEKAAVDAERAAKQAASNEADIQAVQTPAPKYPAAAYEGKVDGKVILIVDVAADGSVSNAIVEKAEPAGVFEENTLAAVREWKFEPAIEDGKPVAGRVRVPVDFKWTPKKADDASPGGGGA